MNSYKTLAAARWRIAVILTAIVVIIYFGFVALIANRKETMGSLNVPGLSVGILLGALVIVASWLSTWYYVRWANKHYDEPLAALKREGK